MTTSVSAIESAKKLAAFVAVDRHVLSNHRVCSATERWYLKHDADLDLLQVIGIGSGEHGLKAFSLFRLRVWWLLAMLVLPGSTVPYVVERIVQQGRDINETRVFIPTGMRLSLRSLLSTRSQVHVVRISVEKADRGCRSDTRRRRTVSRN